MPYCPACGEEYRQGYDHCNDCRLPLTDTKPTPDDGSMWKSFFKSPELVHWPIVNGEPEPPVLLRSYDDHRTFAADQLMLRGMGIPTLDGTLVDSAFLRVFLGYNILTGDLYVPESLYEDARILLNEGGELLEEDSE